jgi:hypothetical protein
VTAQNIWSQCSGPGRGAVLDNRAAVDLVLIGLGLNAIGLM